MGWDQRFFGSQIYWEVILTNIHPHNCSCEDPVINHAHDHPEYGCVCIDCGLGSEVIYDEEVKHNLKKMIPIIDKLPEDIRGDVEAKELMIMTLKRAIEIIK